MAGRIGILPQEAADDLKAAQKLLDLLGIISHLQRKGIAGSLEPLVHPAGQDQRRNGHEQDGSQHDRADIQVHPQRTEHDAAPEHNAEQRHVIVVVKSAQVGGQKREIGCIALGIVLGHRAVEQPLHDALAHLFDRAARQFGEGAAAQPLEKPAGKGDEKDQPHIAQRFRHGARIDEPLELEILQRRKKGNAHRECRKDENTSPVLLEIVVDRPFFHVPVSPSEKLVPVYHRTGVGTIKLQKT